jgi:hypothetical protein
MEDAMMRKTLALSAFALATLPLVACSGHDTMSNAGAPASGQGTVRSYAVSGFNAIDARGPDDVDVRTGGAFSVRAQGPVDMLDQLLIARDGGTLTIARKARSGFHWGGRSVKVFVTMPAITAAQTSGSGDMTIDRVTGAAFRGRTTGSGSLTIDHADSGDFIARSSGSGDLAVRDLRAHTIDLATSGSGAINAAGRANRGSLSSTGSGDVAARDLTLGEASVSANGSGGIDVHVAGHAQVALSGSGDIDVGRDATCSISKAGSGSVRCGH